MKTLLGLYIFVGSLALAAADDSAIEANRLLANSGIKGGLVVHLGCGDGKLTAALRVNGSFIVQGLDADTKSIAAARQHIQSLGLYGTVSVEKWAGDRLPYADNLVNLVVAEKLDSVPMDEVLRVLAPNGVALIGGKKTVKPWPNDIDEWTHFLHDASNNAVAKDKRVAPPEHLQWVAGPDWCRSHEFPSSVQGVVSAGGRVFTILDEGPVGVYEKLPQHNMLVARDAANGLLLWKRPLKDWDYQHGTGLGDRWHIQQTLPRRLVAWDDKVFVTLSFSNAPISVLDGASGTVLIAAIKGTEGADEILCADDVIIAKLTDQFAPAEKPITRKELTDSLVAVEPATGRLLWRKENLQVAPYAFAMQDNRVVYHNLAELVCVDAKTGREQWRVANDADRVFGGGSTLVMSDGIVLYNCYKAKANAAGRGKNNKGAKTSVLTAFDAKDGRVLWTNKGGIGWAGASTEPTDLFVAHGIVWCGQNEQGFDLRTGQVKKELDLGTLVSLGHHPRCYRSKATENFLIWPKRGAEFVDLNGNHHMRHDWLRAPCFTGLVPANGLLYVPPSQCFCYPGVKLSGFLALAAGSSVEHRASNVERLECGPAYAANSNSKFQFSDSDWPMYRHDSLRSGAAKTSVPAVVKTLWQTQLACGATQPVIAGNRLFVAEKDAHCVRCQDAATGKSLWSFTAGGRVDSAPTICGELVLFGCADGSVYCLRAADGELVWRFHAAPEERRVVSFEQVESAWPIHGSVLVQNGAVYFAAGRSSFLDSGITVFALNPATGAVLHQQRLEGPKPDVTKDEGGPFTMEGAKPDVLVSDGNNLYMGRIKFDANLNRLATPALTKLGDLDMGGRHLLATGGFLDDSGFDRLFWMYTTRWPGFYFTQQAPKSGQLIVFNERTTYSVKYFYRRKSLSPSFVPAEEGYLLFADDNANEPILVGKDKTAKAIEWLPASTRSQGRGAIANVAVDMEKGVGFTRAQPAKWQKFVPVRARAMVLAGDHLFVAGPPDVVEEKDPAAAIEGRRGAVLQVFSAADGALLKSQPLAMPPMFDGLSAAGGRLYLATTDGKLVCLGAK